MTFKYLADAETRARRSELCVVSTLLTHACLLNCVYVCVCWVGVVGEAGRGEEG